MGLILPCLSDILLQFMTFCVHKISNGLFSATCQRFFFFHFFVSPLRALSLQNLKTRVFLEHFQVLESQSARPYVLALNLQHLNGIFGDHVAYSTHNRIK